MPKYFAYKRSAMAVATALGVGTVLGIASQPAVAQVRRAGAGAHNHNGFVHFANR